MPKRALITLATFGLVATACISSSTPAVNYGTGDRFVPFVVDSLDDVGQGDAVALTADGVPYVSYFGFPAKLAKGEIATPRPFGAPTVPAVMLSTSTTDGMWQRGAVEMTAPPAALDPGSTVTIPFGPVKTEGLDLTSTNTNGTALALDDAGAAHVAWTVGNTVRYATSQLGSTATVETVFELSHPVKQAGPVGRPSIALDANGNAWVAFAIDTSKGTEVHVAHQEGSKWVDAIAASFPACGDCPAQPTGIGLVGGSPVVVYADPAAKQVRAASFDGSTWTEDTVAGSVTGSGVSFAASGNAAYAAYYTGNGTVEEATWKDGSWTATKVSDAQDPDPSSTGDLAPNTAVAATEDGTVYVAWEDDGVQLSSGTDSFSPVTDIGTLVVTGENPALATSGGEVALGWYDTTAQNQMIGYLADLAEVVVARPSPSLTVAGSTGGAAECGKDKAVVLDVAAPSEVFDKNCLVGPADEKFTIKFDNQDAGTLHNIDVYDKLGGKSLGKTNPATGPSEEDLPLSLSAGTYYFQCDIHPTTMNGTLAVVKGAK